MLRPALRARDVPHLQFWAVSHVTDVLRHLRLIHCFSPTGPIFDEIVWNSKTKCRAMAQKLFNYFKIWAKNTGQTGLPVAFIFTYLDTWMNSKEIILSGLIAVVGNVAKSLLFTNKINYQRAQEIYKYCKGVYCIFRYFKGIYCTYRFL